MRSWIVVLALVALGCGGTQRPEALTYAERAEEDFAQAEEALDDGNYTVALTRFRHVRDTYELSPYAIMAELRLADVYFEQGTYLQAAEAYRQFIQLHPAHEAVPYARFRIGMSYFEDMPSDLFIFPPAYERELGSTHSAHQLLGEFLARYSASDDSQVHSYVEKAQEAYQETSDRLAGYEFYVAQFYLERDRPTAAAEHFRVLLEQYPSPTRAPQALFLLARCYVQLSDVLSALTIIEQLRTEFPQHELTERALRWVERHGLEDLIAN